MMMTTLFSALCWLGWWCNRGGRFHEWAQRRYLDAKHPGEWVTLEELEREYRNEEPTL
jgi:hypothetical protein